MHRHKVVEADDIQGLFALQQAQDEVGTYEAGRAGHEDGLGFI